MAGSIRRKSIVQALTEFSVGTGVGFDDFLEFSANFGKTPTAGAMAAAVPEPAAGLMLIVGLACLIGRRSIVSETRGA